MGIKYRLIYDYDVVGKKIVPYCFDENKIKLFLINHCNSAYEKIFVEIVNNEYLKQKIVEENFKIPYYHTYIFMITLNEYVYDKKLISENEIKMIIPKNIVNALGTVNTIFKKFFDNATMHKIYTLETTNMNLYKNT